MKHTQGPWEARLEFGKLCIRPVDRNATGWASAFAPIAKVVGDKRIGNDIANAYLIASAPELLEALQKMVQSIQENDELIEFFHYGLPRAEAAIAKAMGESK